MIQRIKNKIRREIRKKQLRNLPCQRQNAYLENGNQWYDPVLAGPSTLGGECIGAQAIRGVLSVMEKLTDDRYTQFVKNFYRKGLENFGDNWNYGDISTVLYAMTRVLKVESYLEIGVRKGRSMCMVASQSPECYIAGFDLWVQNYAGMDNPGTDFVRGELEKVGFKGRVEFFSGDSKVTVPKYFTEHPDTYFDLVTVDGDHSSGGATIDLKNVMPRIKIGGALVFDDICSPEHLYLRKVWDKLIVNNPGFSAFSFDEIGLGIGFAIRRSG